jgi:hypothetical protein
MPSSTSRDNRIQSANVLQSLLCGLALILIGLLTFSCQESPDPSFSPLALPVPPSGYSIGFDMRGYPITLTAELVLERQFRIDNQPVLSATTHYQYITIPPVSSDYSVPYTITGYNWETAESGVEWIRSTLLLIYVEEPFSVFGQTYLNGDPLPCDESGYCQAIPLDPHRYYFPMVLN